jgi:hypothetical protein
MAEKIALAEILVGRIAIGRIGGRVDRPLRDDGDRGRRVAQRQAGDDGEIAAGAVAGGDEAGHPAAERRRAGRRPAGCGDAILGAGGEGMFGRESIVDGEQGQIELPGDLGADGLVRVEIAEDEAAAVEEEEERAGLPTLAGIVEAKPDLAAGPGAGEVPDHGQSADLGVGDVARGEDHRSRLVRADLVGAGPRQLVVIIEEEADVRPHVRLAHRLSMVEPPPYCPSCRPPTGAAEIA